MSGWKVLFEENFWGSQYIEAYGGQCEPEDTSEQPSFEGMEESRTPVMETTERRIDQSIEWYGETWKLLSFYTCPGGLVLDYCKRIDPKALQEFTQRYQEEGFDGDDFDEERFARIQLDNPTGPHVHVKLLRGERELPPRGSSTLTYVPDCVDAADMNNDPVSLMCVTHYGLDTDYGWVVSRAQYDWDEGRCEDLTGITAVFDEDEVTLPGAHFHLTGEEQEIPLTHAITGEPFTLCITRVEAQEMAEETLKLLGEEMVYPTHYESVTYYTRPELAPNSYLLKARAKGDSPITRETGDKAAAAVAIIGGSSGPTSVFLAGKADSGVRTRSICSPLFFEPTPVRDWYISYLWKRREPLHVDLALQGNADEGVSRAGFVT